MFELICKITFSSKLTEKNDDPVLHVFVKIV